MKIIVVSDYKRPILSFKGFTNQVAKAHKENNYWMLEPGNCTALNNCGSFIVVCSLLICVQKAHDRFNSLCNKMQNIMRPLKSTTSKCLGPKWHLSFIKNINSLNIAISSNLCTPTEQLFVGQVSYFSFHIRDLRLAFWRVWTLNRTGQTLVSFWIFFSTGEQVPVRVLSWTLPISYSRPEWRIFTIVPQTRYKHKGGSRTDSENVCLRDNPRCVVLFQKAYLL